MLWKSWQNVGIVVVLDQKIHSSELVGKGDGLSGWEGAADTKYVTLLKRGTINIVELVLYLDRVLIVLLHFEVLYHEVGGQHGSLECASSGHGLHGVECS